VEWSCDHSTPRTQTFPLIPYRVITLTPITALSGSPCP